ncbi:glycosyltransferase family 2 protein [Aquipuribacter hungaricus]|uniref:Glycosyltransferase family 2 protein n=1 Tax=Aquipuribacter hungaricus TaxID=545624 RepID=A0ABV7WLY4_9MICO
MSTDQPVGAGATAPAGALEPVDVVVVTYSPGETLPRFLDSLAVSTVRETRVVAADNGSTDGVPEAEAAAGRVELLPTGGNLGYGTAANRGAAGGTAPWLVVANPDIEWAPGALDRLVEAGERHPRGGAFGPLVQSPDGALYPSARSLPSLGRGIGHALLGWAWAGNPWTRAYRQESEAVTERETGWLSGSCLLLRREAFDAVGGFDEGYFMFFEDLDLGERLAAAGWASVYVPGARVTHVGGHTWRSEPTPMLRAHHLSARRYVSRRWSGPRWWPLRVVVRVGLAVRFRLARVVARAGQGAPPTRSAPGA